MVGIQLLQTCIRPILNFTILIRFYKHPDLRKKMPEILFCKQTIADMFNVGVFGTICVVEVFLRITTVYRNVHQTDTFWILEISLPITVLFPNTIIAITRFLSMNHPFWHKFNVTEKRVWESIVIVWNLSFLISAFFIVGALNPRGTLVTMLATLILFLCISSSISEIK